MSKCQCGCESPADWVVKGHDFDPTQPGGKGKEFTEYTCRSFANYLADASAELGFPWTSERIDADR